jgi:hypothetical protein
VRHFGFPPFTELNKILHMSPQRTHRKEVAGEGAAINTNAMLLDPAIGFAMVVVRLFS